MLLFLTISVADFYSNGIHVICAMCMCYMIEETMIISYMYLTKGLTKGEGVKNVEFPPNKERSDNMSTLQHL